MPIRDLEEFDRPSQIDRVLSAQARTLEMEDGDWYEIRGTAMADVAEYLSETGVGHFWNRIESQDVTGMAGTRVADSIRWFGRVAEVEDGRRIMDVVLAAQPAATHDPNCWPQIGHVTGYRNADVFDSHRAAIKALAEAEDLHIEPNHMGAPIPVPGLGSRAEDADPSP